MIGTCNNCLTDVNSRVEVLLSTYRVVVCGACALEIAAANVGSRCEIRAFVPKPISLFVASDNWFSRNPRDVDQHQRELDRRARAYAERVRTVAARRAVAAVRAA